ncbi:hypothetical protein [Psychrobium sp. 1_MG-2023]|uniref:hypothetical protein n=1 Tax=Psychrobium sp. 1_MG-2023 TaxID=3062624 RepID=UPI0027373A2A|nr:hypothetical protein [Psychrobium sp. 1_MG-2023]MDP2560433.1 hypothetical protein [Psychrobium sp. 1_MG-2023]
MKLSTSQSPNAMLIAVLAILTVLMLVTRTHHFASFDQLPSASTAIFFLAGMYLRRLSAFWFFYLLSITLDLSSAYVRGDFSSCLSPSYPLLALSYALMFGAGFYAKPNWQHSALLINIIKLTLVLYAATTVAFFISNGSYYAFSGRFEPLSWQAYSMRFDKYYLRSITNPVFYVVVATAIHFVIARLLVKPSPTHGAINPHD